MPTKKIGDLPEPWKKPQLCMNSEHNPPSHMVFPPGVYEHTCPGCGNKITFAVDGMMKYLCKKEDRMTLAPTPINEWWEKVEKE